ncbi:GTP-binding protein [Psychrobacter sp. B38]|uniref:CobW family GTP-binding protein n=1 Tax=Psychrobacter sp. B38 TaxID=3143538 RepID=UPI00320F4A58
MTNPATKKTTVFQNIPCTLVTGFLGAGKTTVINQLLATKPADERWALLINEFGRIGIDGSLLASAQDETIDKNSIAIREVNGGCICCTSQLPLQIAISRLLSDHHPQRLLIEPTGLAHPRELIRQLSEPHWQTALKMQAVITVLNGVQWQQEKYRTHDGFQAHVRDADVLVINRYAQFTDSDKLALQDWIAGLNPQVSIIWSAPTQTTLDDAKLSNTYLSELTVPLTKLSHIIAKQRKVTIALPQQSIVNLRPLNTALSSSSLSNASSPDPSQINDDVPADTELDQPYRYHETQQDMFLAGWRLPAAYVLKANELQEWLLQLPSWQRIKGIVHTTDGWLQINFTPDSLTTSTVSAQVDSRLEIILQLEKANDSQDKVLGSDQANVADNPTLSSTIDWEAYDRELMALVLCS